jgi:trimethylamine--corrinoid protein Co-methyltransferase
MASIQVRILSDNEIEGIHGASLGILWNTGLLMHHEKMLRILAENGAKVDRGRAVARFPEKLVMDSVVQVGKQYVLHGRNPSRLARRERIQSEGG